MSFQGDVAGIGLGELLQGLSRGGRDGVLTLYGHKISACLGLHHGQLFLLQGPDEEEELWRDRCAQAFVNDSFPEKELSRRTLIARASRQETIFQMLSAPNLHFRFEPGPLPVAASRPATAGAISIEEIGGHQPPPELSWGPGITVEYMLLEHARIADESGDRTSGTLAAYDMPRALDASAEQQPVVRDFLEQCDGSSTVQEIGDRLGWPLTQCRSTIGGHVDAGSLRLASPRELLAAAQRELEAGHIGRAASRLAGWIESTPPGPPRMEDANLLVNEWDNGRLHHILHALEPRIARALMRKLDHIHVDAHAMRERWRALVEAHRQDDVAILHEVALRLVAAEEPNSRIFQELLRLARAFQDREQEGRTRTLLRLATSNMPQKLRTRLELGRRMLETGLVNEGARWLLNTAHALIEDNDPERALGPIQLVLRELPDHAEAGSLLVHTRTLLAKRKRRRVHSVVGGSLALVLSVTALVQYRGYREVESWVIEYQGDVERPKEALERISEAFGPDPPERIAELRDRLIRIKKDQDATAMSAWNERFAAAREACSFGDPMLGLHRALELPRQPGKPLDLPDSERQDLLGVLARRLTERSRELDSPPSATADELNQELRFLDLLAELERVVTGEDVPEEATSFAFRVVDLRKEIEDRRERRAEERARIAAAEKASQQDILLAAARAHANAGDLKRAMAAYDRLMEEDPSLVSVSVLQEEIDQVRKHSEAVDAAVRLAEQGDHEAAAEELRHGCPHPDEHLLPFRVTSRPEGVRVRSGRGRTQTTPFVMKSGVGEELHLTFSHEGFKDREVVLDRPTDLHVNLFKYPERVWRTDKAVEAAPVPTGDDHILADRYGRLLRLDKRSQTVWEQRLRTLGGIKRTPLFMPQLPGHLLVISEDGQAWLVDAASGKTQGPLEVGSPPVEGPTLTREGVAVSFADGRVAVWNDRLEPEFFENEGMLYDRRRPRDEDSPSVAILRSRLNEGRVLVSHWNGWKVEVRKDEFRVLAPDGRGFAAERTGDWVYVAWEVPKALVPNGRLWISDESGLHSYVPRTDELLEFE